MPLFLKIYLFCVAGSCFYVFLTTLIIKIQYRDIINDMDKSNEPLLLAWRTWDEAPVHFKLAIILIPVINLFFCFMLLIVLWAEMKYLWFNFGSWTYRQFTKHTYEKTWIFSIKYWIIRNFFYKWLDVFLYKYLKNDFNNFVKSLNLKKNEKTESKSECDPNSDTESGDQKTPSERQDDKPI